MGKTTIDPLFDRSAVARECQGPGCGLETNRLYHDRATRTRYRACCTLHAEAAQAAAARLNTRTFEGRAVRK